MRKPLPVGQCNPESKSSPYKCCTKALRVLRSLMEYTVNTVPAETLGQWI